VVGLVLMFLVAHGERPKDVIFGGRRLAPEVLAGLTLTPVAVAIAVAVLLTSQKLAPWLHTVEHNPLQDVLASPRDAWLFVLVVIFAGGVREEFQRAFILHRFRVWLGGTAIGLVITSVAFGAGHLTQGADAAIATGLLGLLWGVVYVRRQSAVAPMVSHAGFDLLQIAQFLIGR
jgi:membrane protease YdiL (CAAX protease family)